MVEYCSSVTNSANNNSKKLSGHFLSDFAVFCSCILSNPLYLFYFLFFSPYLLKLLAFLSPLFITTTLLLLSLLTSLLHDSFTFSSLLEDLQQLRFDRISDGVDESKELEGFEEFEVYKIVFGSSTFDLGSQFPDSEFSREIRNPGEEEEEEEVLGALISEAEICGTPIAEKILCVLISDEGVFLEKGEEKPDGFAGESLDDERLDELLAQETSKCEKLMSGVGKAWETTTTTLYIPLRAGSGKAEERNPKMADKRDEEVPTELNGKPLELTPSSIDGGSHTEKRAVIKNRSRRRGEGVWGTNDGHSTTKRGDDDDDYSYSSSRSQPISPSLSNVGSMRKEKEWRRTLACKLFEERHNAGCGGDGGGGGGGGVEGMDMLWEAYEKTEENRGKQSGHLKKKEKEKKMRKGRVADFVQVYGGADEDEEDEDDGEVDNVKLCCLQALKFSAGKMNFGMGRPGFQRISKAFKGIGGGWLSHHSNHQHSGGSKKGKSS